MIGVFQFRQVDVFTQSPLSGNPLAVVLDADALDGEVMQGVAAETNLSETAFVLSPDDPKADYRIRIFTPRRELPFAGHPSVGTAFVLATEGRFGELSGRRMVRQQLGIGVLPIEIESSQGRHMVTMTQGTPRVGEAIVDVGDIAEGLGCLPGQIGIAALRPRIASTASPNSWCRLWISPR